MAVVQKKRGGEEVVIDRLHYRLSMETFARVTVSLPVSAIIGCFVTAIYFQFDAVNETVCHVQNIIPSMSAISSATPQRYFWRFLMGLQAFPRLVVGLIYLNFYLSKIHKIPESQHKSFSRLAWLNFVLYTVENVSLLAVSVVANKENYPIHEKIFITFMITSLCYECTNLIVFRWSHPQMDYNESQSYSCKKKYFISILVCTAGLLVAFWRHRIHCDAHAFSFFSAFEYAIALINIAYHYTAVMDFKGMYWYFGMPRVSNGSASSNHDSEYIYQNNHNKGE